MATPRKPAAKPAAKPASAVTTGSGQVFTREHAKATEAQQLITEDDGVVTASAGVLEIDAPDIEIESNLYDASERAAELAFMEDFLTIEISEGQDQNNPEPYVFLSVNGVGAGPGGEPYVPRGQPVTIKRKYVEVLCRARPASYDSVEKVNAVGERYIEYPKKTSLKYPFTVLEDKNPRGSAWLRKVLAER